MQGGSVHHGDDFKTFHCANSTRLFNFCQAKLIQSVE